MLKLHDIFINEANEDGITIFEWDIMESVKDIYSWLDRNINKNIDNILFNSDIFEHLLEKYIEEVYIPIKNTIVYDEFVLYKKYNQYDYQNLSECILESILLYIR